MKRRSFLTTSFAALGASALPAIDPIKRAGKSHMQLGLAAYGFREYFKTSQGKPVKAKEGRPQWDIADFIDYCADNGIPGAELTAYYFPADADDSYFTKTRHHAFMRGVTITGTAIGNSWAHAKGEKQDEEIAKTKAWIDKAALMSAPHIRVFAGAADKALSLEEATANCIAAYKECADYAGKKGIFLGMENHGGIVAEPDNLIHIIRAVDSPWAGINFDSGNFHTEDPYADLAKIAPYALNVQLKMEMKSKGATKPEPADVPRVLKILRDANYQGWFTLEYESAEDPFVAVPRITADLKKLL